MEKARHWNESRKAKKKEKRGQRAAAKEAGAVQPAQVSAGLSREDVTAGGCCVSIVCQRLSQWIQDRDSDTQLSKEGKNSDNTQEEVNRDAERPPGVPDAGHHVPPQDGRGHHGVASSPGINEKQHSLGHLLHDEKAVNSAPLLAASAVNTGTRSRLPHTGNQMTADLHKLVATESAGEWTVVSHAEANETQHEAETGGQPLSVRTSSEGLVIQLSRHSDVHLTDEGKQQSPKEINIEIPRGLQRKPATAIRVVKVKLQAVNDCNAQPPSTGEITESKAPENNPEENVQGSEDREPQTLRIDQELDVKASAVTEADMNVQASGSDSLVTDVKKYTPGDKDPVHLALKVITPDRKTPQFFEQPRGGEKSFSTGQGQEKHKEVWIRGENTVALGDKIFQSNEMVEENKPFGKQELKLQTTNIQDTEAYGDEETAKNKDLSHDIQTDVMKVQILGDKEPNNQMMKKHCAEDQDSENLLKKVRYPGEQESKTTLMQVQRHGGKDPDTPPRGRASCRAAADNDWCIITESEIQAARADFAKDKVEQAKLIRSYVQELIDECAHKMYLKELTFPQNKAAQLNEKMDPVDAQFYDKVKNYFQRESYENVGKMIAEDVALRSVAKLLVEDAIKRSTAIVASQF